MADIVPPATRPLYHFTCGHGHNSLGRGQAILQPASQLTHRDVPWSGHLVWATDMARPVKEALGLTSNYIACDRTKYRYRLVDNGQVEPWWKFARQMPWFLRDEIEASPGALPRHWWVSVATVVVVFDPLEG